jgi:hypothetical protein
LLREEFEPPLQRARLPRIRCHDLRHTAATLMVARGVPAKASEMLGHPPSRARALPRLRGDAPPGRASNGWPHLGLREPSMNRVAVTVAIKAGFGEALRAPNPTVLRTMMRLGLMEASSRPRPVALAAGSAASTIHGCGDAEDG